MNFSIELQVDHWLSVASGPLCCQGEVNSTLEQINKALAPVSYLTANRLTLADIEIFSSLYSKYIFYIVYLSKAK